MKGIVLAGGRATRLYPLTYGISKQMLPVYDRPMLYYPIQTLMQAGIRDILVIVAPEHSGIVINQLSRDWERFPGVRFDFVVQMEPRGLADAFILGENFIGDDNVTMILGDNIFDHDFSESISSFQGGGRIFCKEVPDPSRFGVVEFDLDRRVVSIEEKPSQPKSNYAAVGIYIYDNHCIEIAKSIKPSPPPRNEIEITDLNRVYLERGELEVEIIDGIWEDAGTHDSLLRAGLIMQQRAIMALQ